LLKNEVIIEKETGKVEILKRKIPVFILILVFALSVLVMLPGVLFAAADDEAEEEEEVIAPPPPDPELLEFDVVYPEIQAEMGSAYEFNFTVTYDMGDEPFGLEEGVSEKIFDIIVEYPESWLAAATPQYQKETEITAVKLKNATAENLRVITGPLIDMEPGEYDIKVTLKSSIEGDELESSAEFKAIITSTYGMDLKTKTGRLSTDITSGKDNHYALIIKNNGSANIENISLSSTEPDGWKIKFDPADIEILEAGEQIEIDANISPASKTIAGDYIVSFTASSDNAEDDIELRLTVETPTIWGIVGIAVIVIVIIAVAFIFIRLGRR
jgi:phage gpG-like protein